jgi:thymidylate kinase
LSKMKLPTKRAPVVDARRANTAASIDKSSKLPAAARNGRGDRAKRKLREGYEQAADDAKRQRRIQVIDAPKMPEQRRRETMHPVLMETSRGSRGGASNTAVRRSSMMHAR